MSQDTVLDTLKEVIVGTSPFRIAASTSLTLTCKSKSFSVTATGTIISAVSSKRLKIFSVKLVTSAALSVNFRDGASTALEGAMPLIANGGFTEVVNPPFFLFGTTAGNSLDLVVTGTGTVAGRVSYWDDDAA